MRILAFLLLLSAMTTGFAASRADLALDERKLDPLITGAKISDAHKKRWREQRDAYLKCPKCVSDQPFPGDAE